jgi:putative thioredoxin
MSTILNAHGLAATPPAAGGDLIKDGSQDTFMVDVIEASRDTPVIVDFWAPWCGPCKQLTPAIESAVRAAGGAVKLVKINVDENQELAGQLRIQSIPTVYAFKDGQPVDGFAGAQPESELRAFIDKVTAGASGGAAIDAALAQADALLAAEDFEQAGALFQQVLQQDNRSVRAIAGFLRCMVGAGRLEQAVMMYDQLPPEMIQEQALVSVKAEMDLAAAPPVEASEVANLRAKIEANPKDHQARLDLSEALYKSKDKEGAVDQLLESIRLDRAWNEAAARQALLKLFEAMGPTDPVTQDARRRLSSILFS